MTDRPHYIGVVLWGCEFREQFLRHCLKSVAPRGNPRAAQLDTRWLVACPIEDWRAIAGLVGPHVEHIPITPPAEGVAPCVHMGIGHKLIAEKCFAEKAWLTLLTPDCMLSDGALEFARKKASDGAALVLAAALRFTTEGFLAGCGSNHPREMVRAALTEGGMHSETLNYEWDAPYTPLVMPAAWWRAPGGIVLHCLSWAPLLADYGAVGKHNTWCLENWTADGNYVNDNWGHLPDHKIYVVRDSDDAMIGSWAPVAEKAWPLEPSSYYRDPRAGELYKGANFRAAFFTLFDPMKRRLFFDPVRWHSGDVDEQAWKTVEAKAQRTLASYVVPTRINMRLDRRATV